MKRYITLLLSFILLISLSASEPFRVMFYNVENLFDCEDDTLKNDEEFLPTSIRAWTTRKYNAKLKKIAKVIIATGRDNVPDLVGLCEVENNNVIHSLIEYSPLQQADYGYVMTDSPDERGIDVALLYQKDKFNLIQSNSIHIPTNKIKRRPTRDILHACGKLSNNQLLDVFVYHAPSRAGGEKVSEPFRKYTASILKAYVDSVFNVREKPNIIIMGDFNDYPTNQSIISVLGASKPDKDIHKERLYNLMSGKKPGTYRYKGVWGVLDQFIVSGTMLGKSNQIYTSYKNAHIANHPFIMEEDNKYGGLSPSRTYVGMKYHDGYSDHLPIYVDFIIR